ncbi:serine/threonine-protein kinase [Planobispora rosea]|uniref:serine/threonine-protein kinase n=1 Tax=Planobispora rosea TaxID=35762 RepID=UPI00083A86DD|nr:serine/threonine-protein kinase [Planobispora rosea]
MPVDPLRTADPARIGHHRIIGRLGAGGQGVVYLAESPSGERVAVKLLRTGVGDSDSAGLREFHREIELALRVKAFCTAQVLEHGEFGGMPYIVSEYVDGPSLARVISERGVLRGTELRRLAVGTLTALSAIHQAGVVHRDLKPANVLLARDGPRVIDFGIARAADSEATAEHVVGTPPYMAPEQFNGAPTGPASDMFAWAATVTCAATGTPPFGTGPVPATIHRILSGEPKLGELEGELRELVLQCLAKDPAARPTATTALLRLLGHSVPPPRLLAEGRAQAGGYGAAGQETGRQRTGGREAGGRKAGEREGAGRETGGWETGGQENPAGLRDTLPAPGPGSPARGRRTAVAGLAAVALALSAGVGIHLARAAGERPEGPGAGTADRGAADQETAAPLAQRRTDGTMAPESTTSVRIPGTRITLRENPADSWRVTSYEDNRDTVLSGLASVRARDGDTFERFEGRHDLVVSPGGSFFVASPHFKTDFFDFDQVRIVDRVTGQQSVVRTVQRPAQSRYPRWSPDGSLVLLTTFETVGAKQLIGRSTGFTIVDMATRRGRHVPVADDNDEPRIYAWGPDGTTVIQQAPGGAVRVRNLDGTLVRTLPSVGEMTWSDVAVTPLGTVVTTVCPDESGNICLWDYVTGAKKATVPLAEGTAFAGWLGGRNLLAVRSGGREKEVVVLDLQGRPVRVLAEGPAAEMDQIDLEYTAVTP